MNKNHYYEIHVHIMYMIQQSTVSGCRTVVVYVLIKRPLPVIHSCLTSKREVRVRTWVLYFLFFLFKLTANDYRTGRKFRGGFNFAFFVGG